MHSGPAPTDCDGPGAIGEASCATAANARFRPVKAGSTLARLASAMMELVTERAKPVRERLSAGCQRDCVITLRNCAGCRRVFTGRFPHGVGLSPPRSRGRARGSWARHSASSGCKGSPFRCRQVKRPDSCSDRSSGSCLNDTNVDEVAAGSICRARTGCVRG